MAITLMEKPNISQRVEKNVSDKSQIFKQFLHNTVSGCYIRSTSSKVFAEWSTSVA